MIRFKRFLTEEQEDKHIVMTFGRMNPPHIGHMAVVNKVRQIADKNKYDHAVIMSHTNDRKKNPLPSHRKMQYAKTLFPRGTNLSVSTKASPSLLTQAADYNKKGYNHLHVVVGSDRVKEFHNKLNAYNGKNYNFKSITVHSAGSRTGKSSIPVSASMMRKAAADRNYDNFKTGLPKNYPSKLGQHLFHDVQRGMK